MTHYYLQFLLFLILIPLNNTIFAEEPGNAHYNLNIVDRLARIEEGQKAIISEIQIRFKAVDERFEATQREINSRFDAVNKRFDAIQREMNSRFDAIQREMNSRFDAVDKRFDAVDKRIDLQDKITISLLVSFLALIGYAIWDRKTSFEKYRELLNQKFNGNASFLSENQIKKKASISVDSTINQDQPILVNMQEKINQIISVMEKMSKQSPEMRNMMQTEQLI